MMEECESVAFEMTELQESRYEASDVISQDDEDEVEELQNRYSSKTDHNILCSLKRISVERSICVCQKRPLTF